MAHTHASNLYRASAIPSHEGRQMYASIMVLLYLNGRYGRRVCMHRIRIVRAIEHMGVRI